MTTLKQVATKLGKQLRAEYKKGVHIIQLFKFYLGFLAMFCNDPDDDKALGRFTKWQIDDMIMCIYNAKVDTVKRILEVFLLYTRRGGKTRNLTIIAVFLAILGYKVMWRASFTDQLNMAKFWFGKNPFFIRAIMGQQDNRIEILHSPAINFDVIAPGKTQSRGVDVLIIDEECMIVKDSAKYDIYEKLRACVLDSRFKHILHGTTSELNTVAEINFFFLKDQEVRDNTRYTAERDCDWCDWITPEVIEGERLLHEDDPYYVDMQYYLKWTVPGGKVFNNIIREGDPKYPEYPLGFLDKIVPQFGGVDFNGDINEHYLVLCDYNDHFVYITHEIKFTDLEELFKLDYQNISLELEDGLYNDQFTKQTKAKGLRCIYNLNWTGEKGGDKKMIRVQELRNRLIIINKGRCPQTWKNLNQCAWNRFKLRTEIVKTKDQHGLDALLHAMHPYGGSADLYGGYKRAEERMPFKKQTRLLRV